MANPTYPVQDTVPSHSTNTSSPISSTSPVIVSTPSDLANASVLATPPVSSEEEPVKVEAYGEEHPTDSHILANADHEDKGVAQLDHGNVEVKDLGWDRRNSPAYGGSDGMPTIVGGLDNAELWTLIRRFNKQIYHVKALEEPPIGRLDLNIADEEEFSPDKLRANVERLYMTVIVGLVGFWKHIARLRSWKEQNRTMGFLAVYSVAWGVDFLVPTILALLITLIVYPPSRAYCFPPAPIALIDGKTGGIKKPTAGVLGSDNSLTGAPEKHQGEAVEQEASNFVSSFTSIAISSAAGKNPQADPHDRVEGASGLEDTAPDPTDLAMGAADAKDKSAGAQPNASHDKTKEPMSAAMWSKTRPVMHVIADIADGWERFGNALSPTPPFPQEVPRMKLAAVLVPLLLGSMFTTPYMVMKVTGAFAGFAFFGDPLIWRGLDYLNKEFPDWQKLLQFRHNLLKGVPTNAQLTLTLLRIGEANNAPIPPPPYSNTPPPEKAHSTAGEDLEHLNISSTDLSTAIHPASVSPSPPEPPKKHKPHGHRVLNFLKHTTKTSVSTLLSTDRLKAASGSEHAKNRLGVLHPSDSAAAAGPIRFEARYKGKRGYAYVTAAATTPALSWRAKGLGIGSGIGGGKGDDETEGEPVWSIGIEEIREIKKLGGLGWKTKMIVGWATDREVRDGLLIIDKHGVARQLTAVALREELFNRLVAMGKQVWESW